jgi:hypothetical protein
MGAQEKPAKSKKQFWESEYKRLITKFCLDLVNAKVSKTFVNSS